MYTQGDKGKIKEPIIYFDNSSSSMRGRHLTEEYLDLFGKARDESEIFELYTKVERKLYSIFGLEGNKKGVFYFLPNSTYALNGIAYLFTPSKNVVKKEKIRKQVYISDSEHASNHLIWLKLTNKPVKYLPLKDFSSWELPSTNSIFSFSALTNLEGIYVPIKNINDKFRDTSHICIVDGSQFMQYEIPNLKDTAIDYFVFTAHKFFGPNGIGVVYSRSGKDEDIGVNAYNCSWMANNYLMDLDAMEAWLNTLDIVEEMFKGGFVDRKIKRLNSYFLENFPKDNGFLEIINANTRQGIFLLRVTHEHISGHDYSFYLSRRGIITRFGLSCAWLLGSKYDQNKIIRVSLGPLNSIDELDRFFDVVKNFSPEECF